MKNIISKIIILFGSMYFGSASATSHIDAKITQVLTVPNYGNSVLIKINVSPVVAGCHTNSDFNYSFDASTASGKMYLSTILTAFTAQKDIDIAGYGNAACAQYGVEDLYHIVVKG